MVGGSLRGRGTGCCLSESVSPLSLSTAFSFPSLLTFVSAAMSSIPSAPRQRLPNEMLTNILVAMDPWDVWPLRRVCHNFNTYIMRYLAPRRYLPMTTIFVRGEDSWVFVGANTSIVTPSTPGDPAETGGEVPAVPTSPFSSITDHRGQKLAFLATRVPDHPVPRVGPSVAAQPIAEFLPALESERDIIQMKLDDRVQVIIRVGAKYFRHVQIPSLVVDRETLVMSLDWRELFNTVLNMPEDIRRLKDVQAWPSKLWIPDAYYWVDRPDSDMGSGEDSDMYISEPSVEEVGGAEGEGDVQSLRASEGSPANEVEVLIPAPVVVAAAPPVENWDEQEALTELTEVLLSPEESHVGGFTRDEVAGHPLSPSASEGGSFVFGPAAYGEGLTTTEEALREAFAPSYALLLDYEESSSEGGRSDEHVEPLGELRSIAVTSEEYLPHSVREGVAGDDAIPSLSVAAPLPLSAQSRVSPAPGAEAATSELTPPSGSGDGPSPRDLYPAPETFLVFEDTSTEDTSSDSAGIAATTGHGSTMYRSIGVQVHPVMLNAGSTKITRHHSWP